MGAGYSLGARDLQGYDIVFDAADIDAIIEFQGWPIHVSAAIAQKLKVEFAQSQKSNGKEFEALNDKEINNLVKRLIGDNDKVIVGVHGLFNRGKTFVLNKLAATYLPSDRRITTKGLSFKQPERKDLRCIFLDTAGHGAPLRHVQKKGQIQLKTEKSYNKIPTKVNNEMEDPKRIALLKKKVSEDILQHLAFELSDVVIVVLNELSWSDQEYLDAMSAKISKRTNQHPGSYIIIIHNYYNTQTLIDLSRLVDDFIVGCFEVTMQTETSKDQNTKTIWYKSVDGKMRHVFLARDNTEAGRAINEKTFALIRNWINGFTSERTETIVDQFCQRAKDILALYLKQVDSVDLKVNFNEETDENKASKYSSFYIEVKGAKQLMVDRLYYEGFRFVLATRSQYELPMDAVMTPEGLVVVCDLPMLTKDNVKCHEHGPFSNVQPTVTVDARTRKAEFCLSGARRLGYYKMAGEKVTDELVLYEPRDCLVSSRHAGPIVGELFSIPGIYDTKITVRAIKNGIMQLFIPHAKKEEEDGEYQ